jgi:hypothetical protein
LKDKPEHLKISVENLSDGFEQLSDFVGAQGDLTLGLSELNKKHNTNKTSVFGKLKNVLSS